MALKPHEQRVVDEMIELDGKRDKLEAFTKTETFVNLSLGERTLLREQCYFMKRYSEILAARINLFKDA